jgi:serine/threonine-protein kinase
MHPHLFQSDEMRERFKLEARIAAHVESEYIVDVSDAGVDEATKTPFLVMELLRGEELGDRLKRLGRLPPGEVVTYLQQTAWALDRTHAASIVHRDLKPENLFLTQREDGSPRIKILDFGVAKVVAEGATGAGATRSLGTPLYMAPEQFRTGTRLTALGEALGAATGSLPAALPAVPATTGPVTAVGAITPAPAASVSSSGPGVASGSGPHPSTLVLERAATSTGAAMTPAPAAATVAVEPAPSVEPAAPAPTQKTSAPATTQARPPSTATPQTVPTGNVPPVKASATPAVKATAAPLLGRD